MRAVTVAAIATLMAAVRALEFNPDGNAFGFDMHRRQVPVAAMRKRDNPTVDAKTTFTTGLYYVNITLGTPPQQMAIQIDTGSADFWMPTLKGACDPGCLLGGFDPKRSSTYKVVGDGDFNTSYAGLDTAAGDFGNDKLGIGGYTLDHFTFGVASEVGGPGPIVGVMGLSYFGLEQLFTNNPDATGYPTIVDALWEAGKIDARAFSLYSNDFNSPGSLLFGGVDTAKFEGELAILDLQLDIDQDYVTDFTVTLTGLSFTAGGQVSTISLGKSEVPALLDSGTADLTLPDDAAMEIYKGLGVVYYPGSIAAIPCDADVSGMTFNFTFGTSDGPVIGVPVSQFIVPYDPDAEIDDINGTSACEFGVQPISNVADGNGEAILGDSFLRGAYVVFDLDNDQVAIAPAILNATGSNILPIRPIDQTSAAESTAMLTAITSNSIPSATYVMGQTTLSAPSYSDTGTVTIPSNQPGITETATFKGLPSGGVNKAAPSNNAAPSMPRTIDLTPVLVTASMLVLSVLGGTIWAL